MDMAAGCDRGAVMEAPTGQRFCVVRMKHPEQGAPPTVWD
jgi:hypothetical protein